MNKHFFTSLLILLFASSASSQVHPPDSMKLKHTQVMLEYKAVKDAAFYFIHVTEVDAGKQVYTAKDNSTAHLIKTGLQFGKNYTWTVKAADKKGNILNTSETYLFSIASSPILSNTRFEVPKYDKEKSLDGLICTDYGIIIDRSGNPVLFLDTLADAMRHCRLNKNGYITFTAKDQAYETNLEGNITWLTYDLAHDRYVIGQYHHQVHRLENDNFLCLAQKKDRKGKTAELIVELGRNMNVVRVWDQDSCDPELRSDRKLHVNSVDLDAKGEHYLISCRDEHSLIKIHRETGRLVYVTGKALPGCGTHYGQSLFYAQHSASYTKDGRILLFNNNTRKDNSSILIIKEPSEKDTAAVKLWQYTFNFANPAENHSVKTGSVEQLENGNYLIAQGSQKRNFEINEKGEMVWECLTEKRSDSISPWVGAGSYSAHYVSSLYPCYFTATTKGSKILLTNEGSEADTYTITTVRKDKVYNSSVTLKAGEQKLIKRKSPTQTVIIKSHNNPWYVLTP